MLQQETPLLFLDGKLSVD